jgi:hypothetical protein
MNVIKIKSVAKANALSAVATEAIAHRVKFAMPKTIPAKIAYNPAIVHRAKSAIPETIPAKIALWMATAPKVSAIPPQTPAKAALKIAIAPKVFAIPPLTPAKNVSKIATALMAKSAKIINARSAYKTPTVAPI